MFNLPFKFISDEVEAQYNEPPVMYHPDFLIMRKVYFDTDNTTIIKVDPYTYTHRKSLWRTEWDYSPA